MNNSRYRRMQAIKRLWYIIQIIYEITAVRPIAWKRAFIVYAYSLFRQYRLLR